MSNDRPHIDSIRDAKPGEFFLCDPSGRVVKRSRQFFGSYGATVYRCRPDGTIARVYGL